MWRRLVWVAGAPQDPIGQKVVGILDFINLSGPDGLGGGVKILGVFGVRGVRAVARREFHGPCAGLAIARTLG